MSEQRKDGFYWVYLHRWEPAEKIGIKWYILGRGPSISEDELLQIGPRIERNAK